MNTDLIRSFIVCCRNHSNTNRKNTNGVLSDAQHWEAVQFGADGRDIISMSALDIQSIFELDANLSTMIFWFISDQLTAHLPRTRPQ